MRYVPWPEDKNLKAISIKTEGLPEKSGNKPNFTSERELPRLFFKV
jgi:hypothetical protein